MGPHRLTHPVDFPSVGKPEYLEKTCTTFGRALTYSFRIGFDWFRETLGNALLGIEPATSEVKGQMFDRVTTIYHVVLGLARYNFQRL